MKEILQYALDRNGILAHIDSVANGNNCDCVCPACNEPLVARNEGRINIHHFAHQSGLECSCAYETTLHLLAKEKIQKAFYENKVFNIKYEYTSYCTEIKTCKFIRNTECKSTSYKTYNLKKYGYDTCEQEKSYDNIRRRSDLKISSTTNPKAQPIYIEFYVTHGSDEKKLHSGCKIIEIKLENEEDINKIICDGFVEDRQKSVDETVTVSKTKFYNFKREDFNSEKVNQEIVFFRCILYESGKSRCFQDKCLCKDLKKLESFSLYEICFHTDVANDIYNMSKWIGYRKFGIPNCTLCRNYIKNYNGQGRICRFYKILGINQKPDTLMAKKCSKFNLYEEEMNRRLHECDNDAQINITELL